MKQLYIDIKARLAAKVPDLLLIAVYNGQFDQMEEQEIYSFPFPCAFIEIVSETEVAQLGNGVQIYDPLYVKIHIGHEFYNGDNQEENLDVFDLKQKVFVALQKFEPTGAVAFVRTAEEQDSSHTNVYHFIQTYSTNYIDQAMIEPVGGVEKDPPFTLELDIDLD